MASGCTVVHTSFANLEDLKLKVRSHKIDLSPLKLGIIARAKRCLKPCETLMTHHATVGLIPHLPFFKASDWKLEATGSHETHQTSLCLESFTMWHSYTNQKILSKYPVHIETRRLLKHKFPTKNNLPPKPS